MLKQLIERKNKRKSKSNNTVGDMNVNIAEICGKKFATGLIWKTIENPRIVMKEARQYGKDHEMDIVAIRDHPEQTQAGYVKKSYGVTKDMYSLATAVTGILEQNTETFFDATEEELREVYRSDGGWLVVIPIPKTAVKKKVSRNNRDEQNVNLQSDDDDFYYYLLASSKGVILPQTDRMGSFSYIQKEANRLISLFHGDQGTKKTFKWIFAPEKFNISESEIEFDMLITNDRKLKDYRLKPLTFGLTKKELAYIIILSLVAGSYMGWQAYERKKAAEQEAEMFRQQQQIAAEQAARIKKQTGLDVDNRDLIKPWITRPSLHTFLSVCNRQMMSVPPDIAGWQLKGAECTERNVTAFYTRMPLTTVKEFRAEVIRLFSIEPDMDVDGNGGNYSLPVNMPPSGKEDVIDAQTARSEITSLFQGLGLNYEIKIEEQPVIPPLPGQQQTQERTTAPWSIYDFKLDTFALPVDVFAGFTVPVVRLDSVIIDSTKFTELKWKVKGKLYVESTSK